MLRSSRAALWNHGPYGDATSINPLQLVTLERSPRGSLDRGWTWQRQRCDQRDIRLPSKSRVSESETVFEVRRPRSSSPRAGCAKRREPCRPNGVRRGPVLRLRSRSWQTRSEMAGWLSSSTLRRLERYVATELSSPDAHSTRRASTRCSLRTRASRASCQQAGRHRKTR